MARNAPFRERTKRRLSIVTGRAKRSLPNNGPKHRSVFFHMPKCGGTSLSEAMYATVPFTQRIGVLDAVSTRRAAAIRYFGKDTPELCHEDLENGQKVFDFREAMMLQHMSWDTMLIHGHVLWSKAAETHFGDDYKYVTLLRDPISRTISNYRMAKRNGIVSEDFDGYLESDAARRQSRVYLRYLAGQNDIAEDDVETALASAKDRLNKFALVGFLDDTKSFFDQYQDIFGVKLRMAQLNAAPDRKPDFPEAQMQKLRALCAPDQEIFEHARKIA